MPDEDTNVPAADDMGSDDAGAMPAAGAGDEEEQMPAEEGAGEPAMGEPVGGAGEETPAPAGGMDEEPAEKPEE